MANKRKQFFDIQRENQRSAKSISKNMITATAGEIPEEIPAEGIVGEPEGEPQEETATEVQESEHEPNIEEYGN